MHPCGRLVMSCAFILGDNTRVTLQGLYLQRKTLLIVDHTLSFEIQCCLNTWDVPSHVTEKNRTKHEYLLISFSFSISSTENTPHLSFRGEPLEITQLEM